MAVRRIVERAVAVGVGASLGLSGVHPLGAQTRPALPRVDVPVVRSALSPARPPEPKPQPQLRIGTVTSARRQQLSW